ncbi:MAG: hypothetical protein QOG63_241 [Thermoleophilaceae bacterium]|nr:hypothetical protein [Thermoleophilaceae bacterium]
MGNCRPRALTILGALLAGLVTAAATPGGAAAANWPQFQAGPTLRGFTADENGLSPTTVGGLQANWTSPADSTPVNQAVVVNGVLYQLTVQGTLSAIDLRTHATKWAVTVDESGASDIAVRHGRVFVAGARTFVAHPDDYDLTTISTLRAYRAGNGALLWSADTDAPGTISGPTVAGGVVYVARGQFQGAYFLEAYRTRCGTGGATCAPIWRGVLSDFEGETPPSAPAVAGGKVLVQTAGTVSAFRVGCAPSGPFCPPDWESTPSEADPHGVNPRTVVVYGGLVYAGSAAGVNVYDLAGCGGPSVCAPVRVLDDGTGNDVFGLAVDNRFVWAFDRNGKVNGYARACTAATCAPACSTPSFAPSDQTFLPSAPPVLANGVLYIRRPNGRIDDVVEAYDIRKCRAGATLPPPLWSVTVPEHRTAAPTVTGGAVYVPFPSPLSTPSPGPGFVVYMLPVGGP